MRKEIERQMVAMEGLNEKSAASVEFAEWRKRTEETLTVIFGENSSEVQDFNAIYYTPVFLTCCMGDEDFDEAFRKGLDEARELLVSLVGKIRRPG